MYHSSLLSLTFLEPPSSGFHPVVAVLASSPLPCHHPSFPKAALAPGRLWVLQGGSFRSCFQGLGQEGSWSSSALLLSLWWLWAALMVSVVSLEGLGGASGPWLGLSCLSGAAFPREVAKPPQALGQVQSYCSGIPRNVAGLLSWVSGVFCLSSWAECGSPKPESSRSCCGVP